MTGAGPLAAGVPLQGDFETVVEAMDAAAAQFGDREAYVDGAQRVSFAGWAEASRALSSGFAAAGVRFGDVVGVMLPASFDFASCCAAALRLGAVVSGLNPRLGPREISGVLGQAPPSLLVVPDESVAAVAASVPPECQVVPRSSLASMARTDTAPPAPRDGASDDPAVIVWTSGTTGVPKGAWFDHSCLRAAVATAGVMTAPFDRRLASTPFAHAGYLAKLWEQVAWGVTLVISPTPWTADDMVRLLVEERITVAGAVPTQWEKVVGHPALDGAALPALRLCVAATAPTPPELVERVTRRFGCPLVVRYAMTECPSITGTEPGDDPETLYRTVGRAQAGVELELRDDAGTTVPVGTVGRIHVRSAGAMRGYWGQPALTDATVLPGGWVRSGDLGFLDDAGNLVLVGRATDMYIRGGYNVYPLEVEHVLAEHPAVAQAAVVGVGAAVIGEIGVAFVVPVPGAAPPELEELRSWCRGRLADYKAPDRVLVVDSLPLTAMMKVDKSALQRLAAEPTLS